MVKNDMKILFVTYSRSMFGANLCMLNLIMDLKQRYQIDSFVLMSDVEDGNLSEILQEKHVPYAICPMKHWVVSEDKPLRLLRGLSTWLKNRCNIWNIERKVRIEDFDLIYTNNSTVQTGAYLAYQAKKPHIWHVREYGLLDYNIVFNYPERVVNKWFKRADKVITVSNKLAEYVGAGYGKGADIQPIHDGVLDDTVLESRKFLIKAIYHFCCVGVLQSGKNQFELLKAAKILLESGENRFHIDLIGDGTEYKEALSTYVKENDLQDFVTLWGYRNDVSEILVNMDVGVVCSKAEAFGRVTCEYMAASMPVIGTREGGTAEIVEDGKTGFLYQPGVASELADCMKQLINHPKMIEEYGHNARESVIEKYTIKRNTDEIYKVMDQVLLERGNKLL